MIYFTSDLHFSHQSLLKYMPETRPFTTVEEMNEYMIKVINFTCNPKDDLYILGDVIMGQRKEGIHLLKKLNPKLHLIRGNHDKFSHAQEEELFESAADYAVVKYNKQSIVCLHYPIERWDKCQYGRIHLHGHCHGDLERKLANRFDIGWDVFQKPISIEEVLSWRIPAEVAHHGEIAR